MENKIRKEMTAGSLYTLILALIIGFAIMIIALAKVSAYLGALGNVVFAGGTIAILLLMKEIYDRYFIGVKIKRI